VAAFRAEHEADPFLGWVVETYGRHRRRDVSRYHGTGSA